MQEFGHIKDETRIPFVMVQHSVFDRAKDVFSDPVEAYIYMYLKRRAGISGDHAFPSFKTIAEDCICGKTTAADRVNKLIKKGLILKQNRVHPNGGKTSNVYKILDFGDWIENHLPTSNSDQGNPSNKIPYYREAGMGIPGDGNEIDTSKKIPSKKSLLEESQNNTKEKNLSILIADLQKTGFRLANNPSFLSRLAAEYNDYEHDLIVHLMEIAVEKNIRSFSYLDSILKSWDADGITTLEQLKAKKTDKQKPQRELTPLEKRLARMEETGT